MREPLLALNISVDYPGRPGTLRGVVLEVMAGETVGLIGQSGSGKSTIALAVMNLLRLKGAALRGQALFRGRDLARLGEREMRRLRGREIALVMQSPLSALNPALRIGTQMTEAWRAHAGGSRQTVREALLDALALSSLPCDEAFLRRYPREISVGQAQRVLIAISILHRPALLIADEPTSALDAVSHAEILDLFGRIRRETGTAILYISHDLLSIASFCDRVAILHGGEIVEFGPTERVFRAPRHPYTHRLLDAIPEIPEAVIERQNVTRGELAHSV